MLKSSNLRNGLTRGVIHTPTASSTTQAWQGAPWEEGMRRAERKMSKRLISWIKIIRTAAEALSFSTLREAFCMEVA